MENRQMCNQSIAVTEKQYSDLVMKSTHCLASKRFDFANYIGRKDKEYEEAIDESSLVGNPAWDPFLYDQKSILESKALRREAFKTQFLSYSSTCCHKRTRRSHTDEVVACSMELSNILGLNTSLCTAIALCHDIGHAPYGHIGESRLKKLSGKPFSHVTNALNLAQEVERKGKGLNLSFEVLWGVLNHSSRYRKQMYNGNLNLEEEPIQEVLLVMYADKFAYLFGDYNDVERSSLLRNVQRPPPEGLHLFGMNQRARYKTVKYHFLKECMEKGHVSFVESEAARQFTELKAHLYRNVHPLMSWDLQEKNIDIVYHRLSEMEELRHCNIAILVSCMTDVDIELMVELEKKHTRITWEKLIDEYFGITEIAAYVTKEIDQALPDIKWGIDQMEKLYPDFKKPAGWD